jgi:ankyrin repeat protein
MDAYGRTPIWYHALNGDLTGICAELAGGADPSFGDDVNYSPLHAAVQEGRVEAIQLLIEAGADPNKVDNHGNGPLWTAVLSAPKDRRVEIITLLLTAGADPDHKNRYGRYPREAATEIGHGLEVPFVMRTINKTEPSAVADPPEA